MRRDTPILQFAYKYGNYVEKWEYLKPHLTHIMADIVTAGKRKPVWFLCDNRNNHPNFNEKAHHVVFQSLFDDAAKYFESNTPEPIEHVCTEGDAKGLSF